MSYATQYTASCTNKNGSLATVVIQQKDGPTVTPESYAINALSVEDRADEQTLTGGTIVIRELTLVLYVDVYDALTWETFFSGESDKWKIIVDIDGQYFFHGFIVGDESSGPFQDKPYLVTIKATNNLALLKNIELTDVNGDVFSGDNNIIDYIAGALKKTGLDLNIRIRCNYLHAGMQNKDGSLNYDMFQQTKQNYNTYLKDATVFYSCYEVLQRICAGFMRLEYWNGIWQLTTINELQYVLDSWYYVDYDSTGAVISGSIDPENYAQVGKGNDIFPITKNQVISTVAANKSVRTQYNYVIWPEIPRNNKFERGDIVLLQSGNVYEPDENGDDTAVQIGTYQDYTIDEWTMGAFTYTPTEINNLPALGATSDGAFRRETQNDFNVDIIREVYLVNTDTSPKWLQSQGVPVSQGDKLGLSFDVRFDFNTSITSTGVAMVYIIADSDGSKWVWHNQFIVSTSRQYNRWKKMTTTGPEIVVNYDGSTDKNKVYKSVNIQSEPIPVTGTLYIVFINQIDSPSPNKMFVKNFKFDYYIFILGGFKQVSADYWIRTQNSEYKNTEEDEVFLSDCTRRAVKGALIFNNGVVNTLTNPEWYRSGGLGTPNPLSEARAFKELLNLGLYNLSWRKFYKLTGTFQGLHYAPENNQLNKQPIGFHRVYKMVDMTTDRYFALLTPLTMDLVNGDIDATFQEVRADGNDGTQTGDSNELKYVFE